MAELGGGVYNAALPAKTERQDPIPVRRLLTTEWLDLGAATELEVADDLEQIRRINRHWGGERLLLTRLRGLLSEDGARGPLRLLDVATGSADLPLRVVEWCGRRGLAAHVVAVDRNPRVLAVARRRARSCPGVSLVRADARALPLRPESFDYVLCSLFLHQLDETAALDLLRASLRLARRAVLVNELRRGALHYAAAWALARVLTRNPITRNDAPASVRNAYTLRELEDLGRRSGAARVRVWRHAPFRACLVLRP